MKALLLPLTILLITSCGRVDSPSSGNVGGIMEMTAKSLSADEVSKLQSICTSLAAKVSSINVSPNNTYRFSVASKSCENDDFGSDSLVEVVVESTGSVYKFKRSDNNGSFVFSDVETANSGVMGEICAKIASPVSPFVNEADVAIKFDLSNTPGCPGGQGQCISIQKGIKTGNSGSNYEIVTSETMKFNTDSTRPRNGFYSYRSQQSNTSCGANSYSEVRVSLK